MALNIEDICLGEGQSFRLLRWQEGVTEVDDLTSGEIKRLQGSGATWHLHDEVELTLLTHGTGTRLVGDHIERFDAPDLVLLGPNLPHSWRVVGPSSGWCVQISVERLRAIQTLSEGSELPRLWRRSSRGLAVGGNLRAWVAEQFHRLALANGLERLGILFEMLSRLSSSPRSMRSLSTKAFDIDRLAPGREAIQNSVRLILDRFTTDLRLEEVLREAHMSKPTFSRYFRRYTGRTFSEFLNEVRIDQACRLLVETTQPVSSVAMGCGFNNLSHFNRLFRRL